MLFVFHWGAKRPFRIVVTHDLAANIAQQMVEAARQRMQ
jgi:hypothetical protein